MYYAYLKIFRYTIEYMCCVLIDSVIHLYVKCYMLFCSPRYSILFYILHSAHQSFLLNFNSSWSHLDTTVAYFRPLCGHGGTHRRFEWLLVPQGSSIFCRQKRRCTLWGDRKTTFCNVFINFCRYGCVAPPGISQ